MSNLMYSMSVPVFVRMLGNLSGILDKGAAYAEAKKIEPSVLLNARLYPDMFPLTRQVRIAGDYAKGAAARLTGNDPKLRKRATFAELKARIAHAGVRADHRNASGFRRARHRAENHGEMRRSGAHYLAHIVLPNCYFRRPPGVLRHNGVGQGRLREPALTGPPPSTTLNPTSPRVNPMFAPARSALLLAALLLGGAVGWRRSTNGSGRRSSIRSRATPAGSPSPCRAPSNTT
jgi:hypothetical protein